MPLSSPEMRPRSEVAEAKVEAPRKIEGGIRIVRVNEVAERFRAVAEGEAKQAGLTEDVAKAEKLKAVEMANTVQNPTLRSRFAAEAGVKERMALKAASDREGAKTKVDSAVKFLEGSKKFEGKTMEDAERALEVEAGQVSKELKANPSNAEARKRMDQIGKELQSVEADYKEYQDTKQKMLDWNRSQQPPRAEAPRMAA